MPGIKSNTKKNAPEKGGADAYVETDDADTIAKREAELIDFLASFDDWLSVYSYLIDSTFYLDPFTNEDRKNAETVEDCQSATWILATVENGTVGIKVDSEALIVKGLAALLVRLLDGQPVDAVLESEIDFVSKTMLEQYLDAPRSKGLSAMHKTIVEQVRKFVKDQTFSRSTVSY